MEDTFTQLSTALTLAIGTTSTTTPCPHDQLSTAFTLWDPSWTTTKKRKAEKGPAGHDKDKPSAAENVDAAVSTRLSLYHDPWRIKKTLTESDLGNMCRLLVATKLIEDHVLDYLDDKLARRVANKEGAEVMVYDYDTNIEHPLVLKRWEKWSSYVFINKWRENFVTRRDLKRGDEIGLFWNTLESKFGFSVLKRASQGQPAVAHQGKRLRKKLRSN